MYIPSRIDKHLNKYHEYNLSLFVITSSSASGSSSSSLSIFDSSLTELLYDLRRKHVAAAGPQAGVALLGTVIKGYNLSVLIPMGMHIGKANSDRGSKLAGDGSAGGSRFHL